jgi:hypothetical protein
MSADLELILYFGSKLETFVETGSGVGETTEWASDYFWEIYTIEFNDGYYNLVKEKFAHLDHITVLHGDSAELIGPLERELDGPALFYLDGHWDFGANPAAPSGVTPVMIELDACLKKDKDHRVLVDDARLFGNLVGYPDLTTVENFAISRGYDFSVVRDTIVLT